MRKRKIKNDSKGCEKDLGTPHYPGRQEKRSYRRTARVHGNLGTVDGPQWFLGSRFGVEEENFRKVCSRCMGSNFASPKRFQMRLDETLEPE